MMNEEHFFAEQEAEAIKHVLKKPYRVRSTITLFTRFLIVIVVIASLILSPVLFGFLWYHLVVADALSSAIIGIVCGIIFDFFMLLMMG